MGAPTTFIKLDRSITSWRWFNDSVTLQLWIYILIHANVTERDFMSTTIHTGELATSYPTLAKELGRSVKQIRTALNHLKKTGEAAVRTYPKFSVISVVNYDLYQSKGQSKGRQEADYGQSVDKQKAGNGQAMGNNIRMKECKNERMRECDNEYHARTYKNKNNINSDGRSNPSYDIEQAIARSLLLDPNNTKRR